MRGDLCTRFILYESYYNNNPNGTFFMSSICYHNVLCTNNKEGSTQLNKPLSVWGLKDSFTDRLRCGRVDRILDIIGFCLFWFWFLLLKNQII